MGLFGGFRAKFSRSSIPKEAKSRTGVVPLNFRINSEFESYTSPTQRPNDTESVSFRTVSRRRPPTRSATFEDHKRALLEKLKSNSLTNISNQPPKDTSSLNEKPSEPNGTESVRFQELPKALDEEYNKTNSMYRNSNTEPKANDVKDQSMHLPVEESNYIYTGITGSIHHYEQVTPQEEHSVSFEDSPSTLIMMTQHEPEPVVSKLDWYDNDDDDEEFTVNTRDSETTYVSEVTYNDDPEQFHVNVMHHDRNYVSEDELSYIDDEAPVSFTGYSSQAANIFFGESAPPPIRPRKLNKINLGNEEEEEDC